MGLEGGTEKKKKKKKKKEEKEKFPLCEKAWVIGRFGAAAQKDNRMRIYHCGHCGNVT